MFTTLPTSGYSRNMTKRQRQFARSLADGRISAVISHKDPEECRKAQAERCKCFNEQRRKAEQFSNGQSVTVETRKEVGTITDIDAFSGTVSIRFGRGHPKSYNATIVHAIC